MGWSTRRARPSRARRDTRVSDEWLLILVLVFVCIWWCECHCFVFLYQQSVVFQSRQLITIDVGFTLFITIYLSIYILNCSINHIMMKSDIHLLLSQSQSNLSSAHTKSNKLSGQATAMPKSAHPAARDASKRGEAIGSFCPE